MWREVSSSARAARTATVLPAPTSPVITPMAASSTHQAMRATASAWPGWRCSMEGARSLVNGVRVKPQWERSRSMLIGSSPVVGASSGVEADGFPGAGQGERSQSGPGSVGGSSSGLDAGVGDAPFQFGVRAGFDQVQVVDPGGRRRPVRRRVRDGRRDGSGGR